MKRGLHTLGKLLFREEKTRKSIKNNISVLFFSGFGRKIAGNSIFYSTVQLPGNLLTLSQGLRFPVVFVSELFCTFLVSCLF